MPVLVPTLDLSYGELYVAQQVQSNRHRLDLSLQYTSGSNSPQFHLKGVSLGTDFWLFNNMMIGMSLSTYSASPSELQNVLSQRLNLGAVSLQYIHPQHSIYTRVGYSPLHGLVNLFERTVVTTDLIGGFGVGGTQYSDGHLQGGIQAFLEERILLYKSLGITFGLTNFWEQIDSAGSDSGSSWSSRIQLHAGAYVRF